MKKIAIIGNGYVGKAYQKLFPDAYVYYRHGNEESTKESREKVNSAELSIVCVPTPMNQDGSCDTGIIEEVIGWVTTPLILIKSTIPPGTTKRLKEVSGKRICHSAEYVGEGGYFVPFWKYPHPTEPVYHDFMIIGGDPQDREDVLQFFYPVLGATKTYYQVDETTSELIKYMENCSIAAKVTLCNEFYNIAKTFGVNYSQLREGFVLDERQGEMFTIVYKDKRGWSGKCLPKDICALIKSVIPLEYEPEFLKDILKSNARFSSEKEMQDLPERIKAR